MAATIPHKNNKKDYSLLLKLEHLLSPYVAYGIMPLFAFANAGVVLNDISINTVMFPVPLGIICGYFLVNKLEYFYFHSYQLNLN